jgi:hypothetical protein
MNAIEFPLIWEKDKFSHSFQLNGQTQESFYAKLNERIIVMCKILNIAHSTWKEMTIL